MKLYAISDLHVGYEVNLRAVQNISPHPEDWLILAGDVGESVEQLDAVLTILADRFRQVIWVPGNHDLWTSPLDSPIRGVAKYDQLLEVCRNHGVLTPEDEFAEWRSGGRTYVIAPMFLLYDYSFRPAHVEEPDAVAWAAETNVVCVDEARLSPEPYDSRGAWCAARCDATIARLRRVPQTHPLILANHFPLRQDLVTLPTIPRFSLWCGTKRTEQWHTTFHVAAVVSGHLHIRSTQWRDGVRFEEVSLGYPKQWRTSASLDSYLRQILPEPSRLADDRQSPRRFHP